MLDYADSGMMGWPSNDAPGSFWQTPVEEGAARLAELMRHYRPDVVVTYDENGFYGHPDHIQAHRITMAALEITTLTPKVYWTTMPRSGMQRFGEIMREFHEDMPEPDPAEAAAMAEIGLPADHEITTWVDTTAFSGQKFDALTRSSALQKRPRHQLHRSRLPPPRRAHEQLRGKEGQVLLRVGFGCSRHHSRFGAVGAP
ncbi:1D-myo-inositol 2-acetamido-2-deoxy-alpha-D-glucopyranoside deacetylase [Streptomyces hirsutus]